MKTNDHIEINIPSVLVALFTTGATLYMNISGIEVFAPLTFLNLGFAIFGKILFSIIIFIITYSASAPIFYVKWKKSMLEQITGKQVDEELYSQIFTR